jgi:hypothetical protein
MGNDISVAHDPSAPSGHLPGFAREERFRSDCAAWAEGVGGRGDLQ